MFEPIKNWLCGNQNFMLIGYIVLILIIVWLLWYKMKEGVVAERDPITGRLLNPDAMTVNKALWTMNSGGAMNRYVEQDQNAIAGKQRSAQYVTSDGFKADVDRPNFWNVDPELRADQVSAAQEGLVMNRAGAPDDEKLISTIY